MFFLIENEELLKNIMILGTKSAIVWKKSLIANPSTIKKNLETQIKSYNYEATDFNDKESLI